MKKKLQQDIDAALSKALEPPKRRTPPPELSEILSQYTPPPNSIPFTSTPAHPQPRPTPGPVAPLRDYNKRANSIEREAMPAGAFPGGSKKLYDALYLRTRGAINPVRSIRAKKREMMQWAGIRNEKTIEAHLRHLMVIQLIIRSGVTGDNEGYSYEVFLPEEVGSKASISADASSAQAQAHPQPTSGQEMGLGTGQKIPPGGLGQTIEKKEASQNAKTSFKTNTNDDDEAFAKLIKIFKGFAIKLTGKEPVTEESDRWAELAEVIVAELEKAAARADSVSSVPAFSAEHLRRRFTQTELRRKGSATREKSGAGTSPSQDAATVPSKPLTADERADLVQMVTELITNGGYTIEQAETQFGAGLDSEAWQTIRTNVKTGKSMQLPKDERTSI